MTIAVGERTPPLAIVCETEAISSGVASTSPWPIALTATSVSSVSGFGIVLSGGWVSASASAL